MIAQSHTFSRRTDWDTAETEWARALRERRQAGLPLLDLTASNPTRCGLHYDSEALLEPLQNPEALIYDPDPRGIRGARSAVCDYYAAHGAQVAAENVFLTTSTSEAYSFLFRLLCDPGSEVLIAQPSYPLFDFLADLDDVRLRPYPIFYDYGWHLDIAALRQQLTPQTRAIAIVHPNNPTGHFLKPGERAALEQLCAARGLALIVDEVFLDYALPGHGGQSFAAGSHPALTFVLSGLSKVAALPQMKAAWIACFGPAAALAEAEARLEVIADTFLSMNAPVQAALPQWLADRGGIQAQIRERVEGNLATLDSLLGREHSPITRLEVEAGWYGVLRLPAIREDEELALELLNRRGIAVHPGRFFGLPPRGWLVVSLLTPPGEFAPGVEGILASAG